MTECIYSSSKICGKTANKQLLLTANSLPLVSRSRANRYVR